MTNPYLNDHEQITRPHQPVVDKTDEQQTNAQQAQPTVQPIRLQAPVPNYSKSRPRHWGRPRSCLALLFVGSLLTVLMCMASLMVYILLPLPAVDILVMGLDSRGNEGVVTRTDSIMIVGVNPTQFDLSLLSIPRDLFIDVPGYGSQRINTVNTLAEANQPGTGPALLSQSIEANFDIGIDRYARLDFQAFTALIDAVGGIDINVPNAITDSQYPTPDNGTMTVHFDSGWQHMDGERALIYARTRHADDDYRRAERQQQVLSALARKLVNPLRWPAAFHALNQHVETNLSLLDLLRLIPTVMFNAGRFEQLVIDREYILPGNGYSVPNYDLLRPWIEDHFD